MLQGHPKLGAGSVNHEHPVGLHAKLVALLDAGQSIDKTPLRKQQKVLLGDFKTINDKIPRNLGGDVEKTLDVAVLSLDLVCWYARRARDMMEVYRMLQASGGTVATKVIPYEDEGDEEEPQEHHGGVWLQQPQRAVDDSGAAAPL